VNTEPVPVGSEPLSDLPGIGFHSGGRLLSAIALVSVSAIAYEILLMRLLSIVQWHHFAGMVISLALLGYGVSGTVIALLRQHFEPRFDIAFSTSALLLSVSLVSCVALGQQIPFNALEVIWDPRQYLYLAGLYLLFMLPFFFAAMCIGLAFAARRDIVGRIYSCDLLGAGLGAVLVMALLFLAQPQRAVIGLSALALVASFLAAPVTPGTPRRRLMAAQLAWLLGLLYALPEDRIGLHVSEFKGLSQALQVVDAHILAERSSPLGLLTVVESPRVPFRYAPGLSLNSKSLPPDQLGVFTDAEGLSVITAFDGDPAALHYLGDVTAALPYQLLDRPQVLVLGAGAGADVLLALHNGARRVDAVELNPQMADLLRGEFSEFAGHVYEHERVSLELGEARGFVARRARRYDLIQIALLDSPAVSGSGMQALGESYLYTVESLTGILARLEPGGMLAITRWLNVPPRDSLKLAATVIEALRRSGVGEPGRRLLALRNWNTLILLASSSDVTPLQVERARNFASRHSFDMAWYPAMPAAQANRFNRLDRPWVYEGIAALLGPGADAFTENYKFNIQPATDDRPYFFNFFRWGALAEMLDLRRRGGAGLVEWGYLVLLATVVQAVVAGAVLILLPLSFAPRHWKPGLGMRMGGYFFLLGLAFLFVEMAFIQKFILFLSHPLYAVTVVLSGFLVFAGLGSLASGRLAERIGERRWAETRGVESGAVRAAVAGIVGIVLLYLFALPTLFERLIMLNDVARAAISLVLIAPLAFCMGMPFPLGLKRLARQAPAFIPWAWGINGFASVISAALATLLAVQFGFSAVLLLALLFYLLAAMSMTQSASTFIWGPSRHR
jgi:spermidine synthase